VASQNWVYIIVLISTGEIINDDVCSYMKLNLRKHLLYRHALIT